MAPTYASVSLADIAALLATAVGAIEKWPQVRRLIATRDGAGVSLVAPCVGLATELAWVWYTVAAGLYAAAPAAMIMVAANASLVAAAVWAGRFHWSAAAAGAAWAATLGIFFGAGGLPLLGAILGVSYAVQVSPAVWTAYRTRFPTGLAGATWALVLAESLLWMGYGAVVGDGPLTGLGCVGTVAAILVLARIGSARSASARSAALH